VLPTPSSPGWRGDIKKVIDLAVQEALIYKKAGICDIILENMHDVPYEKGHAHPATVATMAVTAAKIKEATGAVCGIQILAGANIEALSVAIAASLDFLRVEGYVYGHIADEGYIDSCAAELVRLRSYLNAKDIKIYADIKKKHSSHAVTSDLSIKETAHAAEFFEADGVIITGKTTGAEPDQDELINVKQGVKLPVFVGSGITDSNIERFIQYADGFIVGSYFKEDGYWKNPVDRNRVDRLVEKYRSLRKP
jgi:hypothetical protein